MLGGGYDVMDPQSPPNVQGASVNGMELDHFDEIHCRVHINMP